MNEQSVNDNEEDNVVVKEQCDIPVKSLPSYGNFASNLIHSMKAYQEILDRYQEDIGTYTIAPPIISLHSEEEQVERYAKHIVFWHKLKHEFGLFSRRAINMIFNNLATQIVTTKSSESHTRIHDCLSPDVIRRIQHPAQELSCTINCY